MRRMRRMRMGDEDERAMMRRMREQGEENVNGGWE